MTSYSMTRKTYNKSEHKKEINKAMKEFLANGGIIQVMPKEDNTAAIQEIKREWKKELKSKE